ncbi:MAG TPA: secretin N-terminal domain-containing protein [Candidatus Limnocylindria bacterium]|nr:secretin N-terminal domain-containing protein [Candidatus Limnocylindria bacterium]
MKTHVLLLAGCIALATVARSQNDPAPASPAAPTNAAPAAPANTPAADPVPALAPAAPAEVAPVSVSTTGVTNELVPLIVIDDVPLIDAVKNLARQAGLNYLPDPKLSTITNQPNVTLRLENVSANDALTAVLDTYNLQIIHDPRIRVSRITVKDPAAAEPLVTRIIQLKNIQPTNVVEILKKTFIDPRSQVMGDLRTSQLIVVTTEKEFPGIEATIAKLDTPTRQVLIEAQIWETAKNPKSVKGIDWGGTFENQQVTYGNGRIVDGFTTTVRPGIPRTDTGGGGGAVPSRPNSTTTESTTYSPVNGGITLDSVKGFHPATAFLSADGLSAVISFFNSDTDTEVVATPRAVTLDNQQAILSVTRAFPIFKITPGSANSPAGSEITYTNLGTILQVTPHIAANSNISLKVIPEVSDISAVDRQIVNGFENTANIYAIRRMETHVVIPSSYTLVLGGLISDRTSHAVNKVPILGDTPFLGALFRKSDKQRDKANLVVFITPTIVGDYDFNASSSDFLQTKMADRPEPKMSFMDSAHPYDWTKPKKTADTDEGKPLSAPTRPDATTDPAK